MTENSECTDEDFCVAPECTDEDFGVAPKNPAIYFKYTHDGKEYVDFSHNRALAALLMEEKVWCSDKGLFVMCNDVFAWACADCEPLPFDKLQEVYDMYVKDPNWGPEVWCIQQRKHMPQSPVAKAIKEGGIWDLDTMGLEPNVYDEYLRTRTQT